jgi:Co/Zn/Cd efflux system component
MLIRVRFSALKETKSHEYLIRFALGGLATAVTGWIAKRYGPETGGLFLAFPAIFSASATLIEKHERERKERQGLKGAKRGKEAAALDACGAALGSVGLIAFGAIVWWKADWPWLVLPLALIAWATVSLLLWALWRWSASRW